METEPRWLKIERAYSYVLAFERAYLRTRQPHTRARALADWQAARQRWLDLCRDTAGVGGPR